MSVRKPDKVFGGGESGIAYLFDNFNLNELGNIILCPCGYVGGRYTVGSIHATLKGGVWAVAALTPTVSNDPEALFYGVHPSGVAITATDTPSPGLAADYWYFGAKVTTAEGNTSVARVWIFLAP